ncbi:flavodoxin [Exiguobacterium sp. S17]|nr:flavodoxin [Exiguobacterium sp. S17]
MKLLIGYVSMSGNTEDIAKLLKDTCEQMGHEVIIAELDGLSVTELRDYDGVLLGAYTWGDGDLPYEAEDFVDDLETTTLSGLPCAAFGSGDTDYPKYCAAVDTIEAALLASGGNIITPGLKIEFDPHTDEQKEACIAFAKAFVSPLLIT